MTKQTYKTLTALIEAHPETKSRSFKSGGSAFFCLDELENIKRGKQGWMMNVIEINGGNSMLIKRLMTEREAKTHGIDSITLREFGEFANKHLDTLITKLAIPNKDTIINQYEQNIKEYSTWGFTSNRPGAKALL